MVRERNRTVAALDPRSAGTAGYIGSVPSPVQQDQGLLASRQRLANARRQLAGKQGCAARLGELDAHIDRAHFGQRAFQNAFGQAQMPVLARPGVPTRFQGRSRGTQDDRSARQTRADNRHIAAVVARRLVLLIATVVFFIDDHQPQIR